MYLLKTFGSEKVKYYITINIFMKDIDVKYTCRLLYIISIILFLKYDKMELFPIFRRKVDSKSESDGLEPFKITSYFTLLLKYNKYK